MASGFRRLIADHASLHNSDLPPNYLFPPSSNHSSIPDDLRQLTILLAGPQGTPYSQGLWRLHLRIPEDYPKSPPKATFRTRIWHPNVEASTGAVCVDTLKRDWEPKLTLRDVLITISCLLIHPNPDSALNTAAGALLQDDYEAFARQAKLMTSIHAPIPLELRDAVSGAKRRGEDPGTKTEENEETSLPSLARKELKTSSSIAMKDKVPWNQPISGHSLGIRLKNDSLREETLLGPQVNNNDESDGEDDPSSASKENDPSLSPSPVIVPSPSPRKSVLGKRPLSALATPQPAEMIVIDDDDHGFDGLTASEQNIAANITRNDKYQTQSQRKSPRLSTLEIGSINGPSQIRLQPSLEKSSSRGSSEHTQVPDAHLPKNTISKLIMGKEPDQNAGTCPSLSVSALSMTNSASVTEHSKSIISHSPASSVLSKHLHTNLSHQCKQMPSATRKASGFTSRAKPRTGLRRL